MKSSQIYYGDYRQPSPELDLSLFATFEFLIRHLVSPSATPPKFCKRIVFLFSISLRTSALLRRNLNNGNKNVGGKQDAL